MLDKLPKGNCPKCGGETSLKFHSPSFDNPYEAEGLFRTCNCCGYRYKTQTLEELNKEVDALKN